MFNFFKNKKQQDELWYSFFKSLFDYCSEIEGFVKVNCKQFDYFLEYSHLSFPYSYEYDEEIERFKKLSFNNMYEVLNFIYSKANIEPIEIENAITNELSYDFLHIRVPINSTESIFFKVFFVTEDRGRKTYRILYHQAELDTLENLATIIQYMSINFSLPASSIESQYFLHAMVALAKYASIEVPKELEERFPETEVVKPVNVTDFERIIELVNLNSNNRNIQEEALNFYSIYIGEKPETNEFDEEEFDEEFYDDLFAKRFDLVSDYWESDWKFDPEEAEACINDLLEAADLPIKFEDKWTFTYPSETYSHDLFPYIQEGLEKFGLNLMDIQTYGDYYVFFLVKSDDLAEILELSEKLALGFQKV